MCMFMHAISLCVQVHILDRRVLDQYVSHSSDPSQMYADDQSSSQARCQFDSGAGPRIERANLDGSDRRLIVGERICAPNHVALDVECQLIYWSESSSHLSSIEEAGYDGTSRRTLLPLVFPFGVAFFDQHVYFTDRYQRSVKCVQVAASSSDVAKSLAITETITNVMTLAAVDHAARRRRNDFSGGGNGGCAHLYRFYRLAFIGRAVDVALAATALSRIRSIIIIG